MHVAALEKQNKEFYAEINNLKAQNEKLNNEVADLVANAQAVEGNGESGRVIELENRISGLKGELEREKKERGVYHKSLVEFEKLFEAACFHRDALFEMLAIERGWNK
jgi:predicted RNase H-like nuclease (RuvC/YqgF family)